MTVKITILILLVSLILLYMDKPGKLNWIKAHIVVKNPGNSVSLVLNI